MSSTKKINLFLFSLLAIVGAASIALASTSENISGWAQSANIGWIKLNNCDSAGSCESGADYGLNTTVPIVKTGTSAITGYAWSANIGWVKFNDGTCPAGVSPCSGATINWSTGKIIGWARACSVYAANCSGALVDDAYRGGWDGYIALNPKDSGGSAVEGLSVNTTTGAISGYAWGSDILGWMQFDGKIKIDPVKMCPDNVTPVTAGTDCPCPAGKKYDSVSNSCVPDIICIGGTIVGNPQQCVCPSNMILNAAGNQCTPKPSQTTIKFDGCLEKTSTKPLFSWAPDPSSFPTPMKPITAGSRGYDNSVALNCVITSGAQTDTIVANPNDESTTSSLDAYYTSSYVSGMFYKNTKLEILPDPTTLTTAQADALETTWYRTTIPATVGATYTLTCTGAYQGHENPTVSHPIQSVSTKTIGICKEKKIPKYIES